MTILLRRIENHKPWLALETDADFEAAAACPPIWALQEFLPTMRDGGGLSMFEVDDESHARVVAGAMGIHREKLESGLIFFISLNVDVVTNAGFKVKRSPGNLHHKLVDTLHREIQIDTVSDAIRLASFFLRGEAHSVEGSEIGKAVRDAAIRNEFLYSRFIKNRSLDRNWSARNMCLFIGNELIEVRGKSI